MSGKDGRRGRCEIDRKAGPSIARFQFGGSPLECRGLIATITVPASRFISLFVRRSFGTALHFFCLFLLLTSRDGSSLLIALRTTLAI
jgi:hypothetical protein